MTSFDGLDRRLTARLDERAAPRAPEGLHEAITEDIARTTQRPAWATLERWIPMETRAQLGAVPRAVIVFALIALLTLVMATAIAIGASNPPKLPPPFGAAANGLIAFQSDGDIYVVQPDGSRLQKVTDDPAWEGRPVWSRDGTKLAYWTGPGEEGPLDLVVANADGGEPVVIGHANGNPSGATWSADGSEIMFTAFVPGLVSDGCPVMDGIACGNRIFVAQTDGSGSTMVGDPDLDAQGPALSPDGRTIAFGGGKGAVEALYLMDWDGTNVRRLETDIPGGGTWAFAQQSWSSDGRHIVTHDGQGVQSIWLVELDETGSLIGTERLFYGFWPIYAPDGSKIRYRSNFSTVSVFDVESGQTAIITATDGNFAPDAGSLLAFVGGEMVSVDQNGDSAASIFPVDTGDADWQRVAE